MNNFFLTNTINLLPKYLHLPAEYQYRKITEKLELEIFYLKQLISRKGRAIDIGANRGLYTYALSHICSVVEAFEPQPWCSELILEYSKKFNKNINVHNCGLSSSTGLLTLNIPIIHGRLRTSLSTGLASFNEQKVECKCIDVPIRKLDEYHFKDVVFIKIDVEGHEKQVIEGAKETIVREKPVLLIEIEQRHLGNISMAAVFNQIKRFGYEGMFLDKGDLINVKSLNNNCRKNITKNTMSGKYLNNFIFMPKMLR